MSERSDTLSEECDAVHDVTQTEMVYKLLPQSSDSSQQSSVRSMTFSNDPNLMQIMNDSKYSKVIFSEVSETYPTDADIECRFYITGSVVPTDDDTIGLFKIGWTDVSQCIVSKTLRLKQYECGSGNTFDEHCMKFVASELPKDCDEFYQFCYLSSYIGICGASTPFRLFRPSEQDLVLDNRTSDDEDFVVVRSQQALLQERLQQMVNANGVLEYSKRSLKQQKIALTEQVNESRKIKGELEDRIKVMQIDAQGFRDCINNSEEKYYEQCAQMENLEQELAELKKIRNDQDMHLEDTQHELMRLTDKLNSLELSKTKLIYHFEQLNNENSHLINKVADQQVIIDDVKSKMISLEGELEISQSTNAMVVSERHVLDVANRLLRNELEDIKAKCDALEGNKKLMLNEISDLQNIRSKTSDELKVMMDNVEEMRSNWEKSESYQKVMTDERKAKEAEMQKQLEEMKLRLTQAADEYQKLYKQNTKLESKIERIKSRVGLRRQPLLQEQEKAKASVEAFLPQWVNRPQIERVAAQAVSLPSATATSAKTLIRNNRTDESLLNRSEQQTDNYESINLVTLPCTMCDEKILCTERDLKPMTNHLEERHSQRLCPVCSILFDFNIEGAEDYFKMHVENHFTPNNQN